MQSTGLSDEDGRDPSGAAGRVEPGAAARGVEGLTVLQLVPSLESGGVERGCVDIARALTAAGATALVASAGGRMESALARAGGRLLKMDIGAKAPWRIRANARALASVIRAERVDVVHARSRAPAWAGWLASQDTGVAFVTTWHGTYSENLPFKRLWNSVMARGRPTIAVSDFIAGEIARRHPEAQVVTIPRGVDLAAFDEAAVSAERTAGLAERWGLIESPRPVVMLPGRLTRWKGQEPFIEAAARLKAIRGAEDFVFLMVGGDLDSDFARGLERRIRARGLGNVAALAGHCDDMAAALKLAAVVVSASLEPEAFGRVAAEAAAMGRPVVASDHGGARETVEEGRNGFRYPPADPQALAEAVQRALQLDDSQRAHMAAAGRARVVQRFSLARMEAETLAVYARAAGRED